MDVKNSELSDNILMCPVIIELIKDEEIALDFYRALCNMQWREKVYLSEEEQIMNALKGKTPTVCSYSWRAAGGIIASMRRKHYNAVEDYLTYYCSGGEGTVTDLVNECFEKMGWEQYPYESDYDRELCKRQL